MAIFTFFLEGNVEDYEEFIAKYEDKELHPNHYHLATAKHSLMQMLGRNEGYLIQDLPMNLVSKYIDLFLNLRKLERSNTYLICLISTFFYCVNQSSSLENREISIARDNFLDCHIIDRSLSYNRM